MQMKFVVKKACCSGGRVGALELGSCPKPIDTPALLLSTRKGLPHFIAPDLLTSLPFPDSHLLQFSPLHFLEGLASTTISKIGGLHHLLSLHQYGIAAVARDSIQCLPESKGATKLGPSFETPCGRLSIKPKDYVEMISCMRPNIWATLADEVPAWVSEKRNKTSVDRTVRWLDDCLALNLATGSVFGAIVGGPNLDERKRCAVEVAKRNVSGGVDLILGMAWLASLGDVKVNLKTLTMGFGWNGQQVEIKGDPTLDRKVVTSQTLRKETEIEAVTMLWQLDSTDAHSNKQGAIDLSPSQTANLKKVLEEYKGVFCEIQELPPKRPVDYRIPIKEGENPVNVRPYRYPYLLKSEIEKQVTEMLKMGIMRPSNSPYSSPIILVKQKNMGVDVFALITEPLTKLPFQISFRFPSLKAGYHQIRMEEGDINKIAFRTHQGHYEFLLMPFGLTNAPATFQCAMNTMLQKWLRKCVLVFFYDMLIYSRTWEDHISHLREVLGTLLHQKFFANKKKCDFGKSEVKYLGHVISSKGVEMDEDKLVAISNWPIPRTVKALRGFLGLTRYYRRFIQNYGKIARPLTNLLKKRQF